MIKKIVVIEDNKGMLENIAEILELANYEVHQAPNGKAGMQLIKAVSPDLILCDIMMPELDGYGVLKILSENELLSSIPFIFMSAKSDKGDFREGMRLGADDYLTKPFEDIQLLESIETRLKKGIGSNGKDLIALNINGIDSLFNVNKAKDDLNKLFAEHSIDAFKKRDTIYTNGHMPRYLHLILSGKVKTSMCNEDGKEFITGLYGEGQFVGLIDLFSDEHYTESAKFISDGTCSSISRETFLKAIYENTDLAIYICTKLHDSTTIRKERLMHLAYDSVRKRTADCLLWINDCYNLKKEYPFKVSFAREDLAAMVGTAKESLIRTLSSFREEGLIDTNTSEIVIYSDQKLRDLIA
jgi:CheY-like chemotaxis protein